MQNSQVNAPPVKAFGTAVVIGRWQLPHHGHAGLFSRGLQIAERLVVVIGSSFRSRDTRQPFNAQERQEMVLRSISPADRGRVVFVLVRDYYDDERWNAVVRKRVAGIVSRTEKVALVGFKKDQTGYYQDHFSGWSFVNVPPVVKIDATSLRNAFFGSTDMAAKLDVLRPYVSAGVLEYLQAWANLPACAHLVKEQASVIEYRKRWSAPWYLTADSLVRIGDHVLLIQRGGEVGHGLWALPGGFVNPNEMFYPAALRELEEETNFSRLPSTMKAALKASATFEHPLRSPRGRLVTNAFYFAFADGSRDEMRASDDAIDARWFHVAELAALEDQLFEDHASMLDHFLGIFGED